MANFNGKVGILLIVSLIVVQVESQFIFGGNHGHNKPDKDHDGDGFFGDFVNNIKKGVEKAVKVVKNSLTKWDEVFGKFYKDLEHLEGFKFGSDGSIQITLPGLQRSSNTAKIMFDIIMKFLERIFPRGQTITLPNDLSVSLSTLLGRLRRVFYLQDPSQLTNTDKEVLNYVLTTLQNSGFQLLGIPSFQTGGSEPWLVLWKLIHGSGGQRHAITLKSPDGKPVTWGQVFSILLQELDGRNSFKLPNGRKITNKYLLRLLQNSGKNNKRATPTEKAVWKYILGILQEHGFSIEGGNPNSVDITQLEFAAEPSGPVEIETPDGKPATLESVVLVLEKYLGGKGHININGKRFKVKRIGKVLRDLRKNKQLDTEQINVLIFIWELLQNEGFKITSGDNSWGRFGDFLIQEINNPANKKLLKSLKFKKPKFSLPKIDFRSILKKVFKGRKISRDGKIEFKWKKGNVDVAELKLILKVILEALEEILKETNSNTIKIANGLELTIPEIVLNLQQALALPSPSLLTKKQKALVKYIFKLVQASGISISRSYGKGGRVSWRYFFDILRHIPSIQESTLQLGFDFTKFKLPQIHWPKFPSFKFDFNFKLPNFDLEKILGNLKPPAGFNILPGGKINFSWQNGNFNPDAALAVLKYLFSILQEVAKQSENGLIDIGNNIKLSIQDITTILKNSFKVDKPDELDDNAKYILDYLGKLLEKFGFSIKGLPIFGRKPLSELLWNILRTQPILPDLNLPSTQPLWIIQLPNLDFHQLWEDVIGSGNSIPGLNVFPDGKVSWEPGKSNKEALKVIWKFFSKLLLKAQEATKDGLLELGDGVKLTVKELITTLQQSLKIDDAGRLSDKAKIAWKFIWEILQYSNFRIEGAPNQNGNPSSWDFLYGLSTKDPELPNWNFLATPDKIQLPALTIPTFKFDGKLLDELKSISGFNILPEGKIQLQWQGGNFDPNVLAGFWKIILNAINEAATKGTLNLGNSIHYTEENFDSILEDASKVPDSQQLGLKQKIVLDYLYRLLNGNGFEVVGQPQDGTQPWTWIWDILSSQQKFPNFKIPSWPDDSVIIVLPSFQWPESEFPTLKFDAIWSNILQNVGLIPGLTFLTNGKAILAWQDGTFEKSTIDLIWQYILRVLHILQKYSNGKTVELTGGISLTWDQIISDLEAAAKKENPEQLSPEEKAVFDFIAAILLKSGLEITDITAWDTSKETPFWVFIYHILHQQPNPPPVPETADDSSFLELPRGDGITTLQTETATSKTSTTSDNDYTDDPDDEDFNKVSFTDTEKQSLETTLESLNAHGEEATGNVEIQGFKIPYSFIISATHLKGYELKTLTLQQLTEIILLFISQAEKSTDVSSDLPADEKVTLSFILDELKTNSVGRNKTIVFEGGEIPVDFILNVLKVQGIDIQKATPAVLYRIFLLYLNVNSKEEPQVANNLQSVLKTLRNFLVQNGEAAAGSILMNGHQISIQQVIATLKLQNINLKEVTIEDLWRVIQLIFSTEEANSPPIDQKTFTLHYFLDLFKRPETILYSTLVFNNVNVSVASIVYCLGLQKDPSTGRYIIDGITKDDLWTCLQNYITDHSHTHTSERIDIFKRFLEIISDPANVQNSVFTIVYNDKSISIPTPDLVNGLDLDIDNATGKYNVDQLTPYILWHEIEKFLPGAKQTEVKQSTLDYFISAISDPANVVNGVLIMSDGSSNKEVQIPLAKLVADLGLKIDDTTGKYDIRGLTTDELWDEIKKYLQ